MANKPRCKECNHKHGPRSTANLTKTEPKVAKKKPCACDCHGDDRKVTD